MRLTHKHKYKKDSQRFVFDMKDYRKVCQKLGQLEDIEQLSLFDDILTEYKITKPVRLISFFSGIEAQFKALSFVGKKH